ncbi:MAG: cyclodeaminase/cyclohydrolase family protein [Oscillospiraceae bacterium]|nr:cyclodeaminase/cyclohydrolase family protein [Oscillospiraceae bacterium]
MTEELSRLSCSDFTEALSSRAPVPGGGGAAALMGALGASLCAMAGNLTSGKKKYAAREEDLRRMTEAAQQLRLRFLRLIGEDAEAFEPLSRAYSKPRSDPDYAQVMREATLEACRAPLQMMECAGSAVVLLEEMCGACSPLMVSDVGCGASAAGSALEAAAMNVRVNTRLLPGDTEAEEIQRRADTLLADYLPRAQAVIASVMEKLNEKTERPKA